MAKAHRLTSRKVQKAPKTRIARVHHHGNITKRLHGRRRDTSEKHRGRAVAWAPGVHKPKGHRATGTKPPKTAATKHPQTKQPRVAGHHKLSAATRAKIAAKLRGRHHKGHALSAAARARIAAKLRGRHHPGTHHKGHRLSAQTRSRIAARLRGHKHPHRGSHAARRHTTRRSTRRRRR